MVKLLVYALCHELPDDATKDADDKTNDKQCGEKGGQQKGGKNAKKERLLPPWAAPSGAAAGTRFGAFAFCGWVSGGVGGLIVIVGCVYPWGPGFQLHRKFPPWPQFPHTHIYAFPPSHTQARPVAAWGAS